MEIKISELSIGDWVKIKGTDKIVKIAQINGDLDEIRVFGYKHFYCFYDLDYIEPILLTPEILERNGIRKTYESDEYSVYKGEGFNVTEYYTELWEFERHRNRLMIRYVHQLQHALRLAGVEKEIEV